LPQKQSGKEASNKAIRYSAFYGGKVATTPKVPIRSLDDFSIWYTPGVAAVSKRIHGDIDLSFEYTNRWNTIGIVTDGSRVLGLGRIGPEAALPVMEGKALIYKFLGGVDAYPLPIRVSSTDEYVQTVLSLEPALGGINLEDTESPKCFDILDRLRQKMSIPVWHDDQQGTAGVILAALYNALELTGRDIGETRITFLGSGAANIAAVRLLSEAGADPKNMIVVDSRGILHPDREDMDQLLLRNKWKYEVALKTNGGRTKGGLADALRGVDVLVAAATPGPNLVKKSDVAKMDKDGIVFLLANPVPEMWPEDAIKAGAKIVATGRSDFPNQVNNSLLFPAIFRGALDVRARTITDGMVIAAAREIAEFAKEKKLTPKRIIPTMLEWEVYPRVAATVGVEAHEEGQARKRVSKLDLARHARDIITHSRRALKVMVEREIIPHPPR